jgi:ATP-dependent Lon protease
MYLHHMENDIDRKMLVIILASVFVMSTTFVRLPHFALIVFYAAIMFALPLFVCDAHTSFLDGILPLLELLFLIVCVIYMDGRIRFNSSLHFQLICIFAMYLIINMSYLLYMNERLNPKRGSDCLLERDYYNRMTVDEQATIDGIEDELKSQHNGDTPLRYKIMRSPLPAAQKAAILDVLNASSSSSSNSNSSDDQSVSMWKTALKRLPLGTFVKPKLDDMVGTKAAIDNCVYGHEAAKLSIMMTLAKWVSNPTAKGLIIGLQGPAGVGKTTLAKEGIAASLGLPFVFLPLGGVTQAQTLNGSDRVYVGATYGRLAAALIQSGCMNPVICLDELDKVADNLHGSEVYNVLMQVTDPVQNAGFHDRYFEGIDLDFSRCIFIFTYNDFQRVDPILRDRITNIETEDFDEADRMHIARHYMLDKVASSFGFAKGELLVEHDALEHMVHECSDGSIRDVLRRIEHAVGKVNLERVTRGIKPPFVIDMSSQLNINKVPDKDDFPEMNEKE